MTSRLTPQVARYTLLAATLFVVVMLGVSYGWAAAVLGMVIGMCAMTYGVLLERYPVPPGSVE